MSSFPSRDAPIYRSNELEIPAHPSPNPLPTSSPTSTYPSSPPPTQQQHELYSSYSNTSTTRILSPLSPPPRPQPLHYSESPPERGMDIIGSPFQKLEVPSATDEQWREWERVTKEAMEKFDHERKNSIILQPAAVQSMELEGEEIRFDNHDEGENKRDERQEGGIRLVQ